MAGKPLPDGYRTVTPYLMVAGAQKFIDFMTTVFGATVREQLKRPDGRIGHAEIRIGDSMVMLSDEFPQTGPRSPQALGGTTASIFLYVPDVDAAFERAVDAGDRLGVAAAVDTVEAGFELRLVQAFAEPERMRRQQRRMPTCQSPSDLARCRRIGRVAEP